MTGEFEVSRGSNLAYLQSYHPREDGMPQIRRVSAVFADISGFTATTQDCLSQPNPEIALDKWIARMGQEVYPKFDILENRYGGRIQYYEGDAALIFFDNPEAAMHGAMELQRQIDSLAPIQTQKGEVKLSITQGIATGDVFTADVGDARRKIRVTSGPVVEDAYMMEAHTQGIRVDHETYRTIEGFIFEEFTGEYELRSGPKSSLERMVSVQATSVAEADMLAYFAPRIRRELLGKKTGKAEDNAAILFSEFPTLNILALQHRQDAEKLAEIYEAHFRVMHPVVELEYGGEIDKFNRAMLLSIFRRNVDVKGHKLSPTEAAHMASMSLNERLQNDEHVQELLRGLPKVGPKQGFTAGKVVIGPFGSDQRRTYTALGDVVNLAARLKGAAKVGQTLTNLGNSEATEETVYLKRGLPLKHVGKINLKGLGETDAWETEQKTIERKHKPIVGRDKELEDLRSILQDVYSGESRLVNIVAEKGIGKTALTHELEREFEAKGGRVYSGSASPETTDIPGYMIHDFIKDTLGVHVGDSKDQVKAKLESIVDEDDKKILHHWLGLQLGYEAPAEQGKQLEKARRKALRGLLSEDPEMLVFNDLHWADEESMQMVQWLTSELPGQTLVATNYRPECTYSLEGDQIELGEFDREGIRQFVSMLIGEESHDSLTDFVMKHSGGIAYNAEAYVRVLSNRGLLKQGELENVNVQVPTDLNELIKEQYTDLQDPTKQQVLDAASCMFGEEFARRHLEAVLDETLDEPVSEKELHEILQELEEKGFLDVHNGAASFKHINTKEAIYEAIRAADKAKTHVVTGDKRRDLFGEGNDQIDELAWDYERGDDLDKAMNYNLLGVAKYVDSQQLKTGIIFADKLQTLAQSKQLTDQQKSWLGRAINAKGLSLVKMANSEKAKIAFDLALQIASDLSGDLKNDVLGRIYGNLCLLDVKNPQAVREHCAAGVAAANKIGNLYMEGIIKYNAAYAFDDENNMILTREAIGILSQFGDSYNLAMAYNNLVTPLLERGQIEEARREAETSLDISDRIKNAEVQGRSRWSLAVVSSQENKLERTMELYEEAHKFFKTIDNYFIANFYDSWVDVCVEAKKKELGIEVCKKWGDWQKESDIKDGKVKLEKKIKELQSLSEA